MVYLRKKENKMLKFLSKNCFFSVLCGLACAPIYAGTVHVQNMDIASQKCVLKFYNTYKNNHVLDIASLIKGVPPIGLDKMSTFDIPNGRYEAIVLDCEVTEPYTLTPSYPSTVNPKLQKAKHQDLCNKADIMVAGSIKTINVKKDSEINIVADLSKTTNSCNCIVVNINDF